jgi:hypothetical protein
MLSVVMLIVIILIVFMLIVIMLSIAIYLLLCWISLWWLTLCWISLCWVSVCWMSWRHLSFLVLSYSQWRQTRKMTFSSLEPLQQIQHEQQQPHQIIRGPDQNQSHVTQKKGCTIESTHTAAAKGGLSKDPTVCFVLMLPFEMKKTVL